jgi:hypothetical protein
MPLGAPDVRYLTPAPGLQARKRGLVDIFKPSPPEKAESRS